jgi:hypothetical protein
MPFDDLPADRQPHPGPLIFIPLMHTFKGFEGQVDIEENGQAQNTC